jgi:hypothetical protein
MDIGTIIAGLNALSNLFNQPVPMTPAQIEEKPKKTQPINTFVIFPNQVPPMGIGVPSAPPLFMPFNYWDKLLSTNISQTVPSLIDLYRLFYNTRF